MGPAPLFWLFHGRIRIYRGENRSDKCETCNQGRNFRREYGILRQSGALSTDNQSFGNAAERKETKRGENHLPQRSSQRSVAVFKRQKKNIRKHQRSLKRSAKCTS